jgi:hypothetical protein
MATTTRLSPKGLLSGGSDTRPRLVQTGRQAVEARGEKTKPQAGVVGNKPKAELPNKKNQKPKKPKKPAKSQDPITLLQERRQELEEKAVTSQLQDIELLSQQIEEQTRLGEAEIGLLRNQLSQFQTSFGTYQQQLDLLRNAQEEQTRQAQLEQDRVSLVQSQTNRRASASANLGRRFVQAQRAQTLRPISAGVLSQSEAIRRMAL